MRTSREKKELKASNTLQEDLWNNLCSFLDDEEKKLLKRKDFDSKNQRVDQREDEKKPFYCTLTCAWVAQHSWKKILSDNRVVFNEVEEICTCFSSFVFFCRYEARLSEKRKIFITLEDQSKSSSRRRRRKTPRDESHMTIVFFMDGTGREFSVRRASLAEKRKRSRRNHLWKDIRMDLT